MKQPINLTHQKGATLIVVLLVLLLIMVAGAMAVRQSRTDLQVATSDQINTVLLQTADNANQKLETIINGDTSGVDYSNLLNNPYGFIGYFYREDGINKTNHQVIYCQTGQAMSYLIGEATVKAGTGTLSNAGYCNDSGENLRYTSSRGVMVSQVGITLVASADDDDSALGHYATGENTSSKTGQSKQFNIVSTAAVPAYSSSENAYKCFSKDRSDDIGKCLEEEGIPQTQVYQLADISRITTAQACVDFGSASPLYTTNSRGNKTLSCLQ